MSESTSFYRKFVAKTCTSLALKDWRYLTEFSKNLWTESGLQKLCCPNRPISSKPISNTAQEKNRQNKDLTGQSGDHREQWKKENLTGIVKEPQGKGFLQ